MPEDGPHLLRSHAFEQSATDGHQSRVAPSAGGKGVHGKRFEQTHLGHRQSEPRGVRPHRFEQPMLGRILRDVDHPDAHRGLGDPSREREGEECAAEAKQRAHDQQVIQTDATDRPIPIQAQKLDDG